MKEKKYQSKIETKIKEERKKGETKNRRVYDVKTEIKTQNNNEKTTDTNEERK
jgi:hypothetical protein